MGVVSRDFGVKVLSGTETKERQSNQAMHSSSNQTLIDHDGKREDSFIRVESINGGNITGVIENDLTLVNDYKTGQRITFSEDRQLSDFATRWNGGR